VTFELSDESASILNGNLLKAEDYGKISGIEAQNNIMLLSVYLKI
jgi:hypothetical protein